MLTISERLRALHLSVLRMEWFVDNYRCGKMFRDGRVLGLVLLD